MKKPRLPSPMMRRRIYLRHCLELAQRLRPRSSKVLAEIIYRLQKVQAIVESRGYLGSMTISKGRLLERITRQQLKDGLEVLRKAGLVVYEGQAKKKRSGGFGPGLYNCERLLACLRTPALTLPAPLGTHFGLPQEVRAYEAAQREAQLDEQVRAADEQEQMQCDPDSSKALGADIEAYLDRISAEAFAEEALESTTLDCAIRQLQSWEPRTEFTEDDMLLAMDLDRFDAAQEMELLQVLGIPTG